ncbi:MAG: hypothetical protein HRU70_06100 [Phycisphaeraceae bacterium]|nr:MAG: hypothetical protein HRU70_06100 [Phycisphaeraceae bacterium]
MLIRRPAHAKLNLALAVGPPIPHGSANAGFHPVASWMVPFDLADEVEIERAKPGGVSSLEVTWTSGAPRPTPIDWTPEVDVCARAHRALESAVGVALPACVRVAKRIPVGGGLGGGSSDAAAVLSGLNDLFGLGLDEPTLTAIAETVGSDVPFFLSGRDGRPRGALIGGFGGRVERVSDIRLGLVLIVPPFGCSTPAVYRAFDSLPPPTDGFEARAAAVAALARSSVTDPERWFNNLAPAAIVVEPRLAGLIEAAERATGLRAHVTGSGSCFFIPCDPGDEPTLAARARRAYEGAADRPVVVAARTPGP